MIRKAKKRMISGALLLFLCCSLVGCGKEAEVVQLSIWVPEAKIDLMGGLVDAFNKEHEDEVKIECRISKEEEDTCRETILANPEGAADIFAFADDQLDEMKEAGALLEISGKPEEALEPFGGADSAGAVRGLTGKTAAQPTREPSRPTVAVAASLHLI